MNRIILLVLFVFSYCVGSSQAISQRGTSAVTVQDARLFAQYNFRPPVFSDTIQANLQIGLDSCGALIFSRDINSYYLRACSPKRWVAVSSGGSGNAWNVGGNASPSSQNLGTTTSAGLDIITSNSIRARISPNGINRSAAARNKYLMIDTTAKYLYYGDAISTIPNLQQVTDAGNTTTNDIKANSYYFFNPANDDYGRLNYNDFSWTFTDADNVIRASIAEGAIALKNKVSGFQFSIDGSNLTANKQYQMPNYSTGTTQVLPTSVNGNYADASGNITISTGGVAVDTIFRTLGKDSIFYKKNNITYSIKDSVGVTTDTTSLSNRINSKLSISDTSSMLSPYLRAIDTTNKFVNTITRTVGKDSIIYFIGGTRYAIKDSVGTNPPASGYYGAFQDNATQIAAVNNTGYPMKLRVNDLTNGITITGSDTSRITFANTGVYNLQFSSQFQNTDNAQHDITIWLRLNGSDVSGSSGFISIPARKSAGAGNEGHLVTGWNYVLNVVAGQYYQIVWSTSNATNVTMQYYAAGSPPPSTASVIATVTQQAGILAGTGITAINSLTGSAQTITTGTSGTDFAVSSTGTTHTFNLPTASATNRGALSTSDWSTFNGKLGASDTISLSNRINGKLTIADTSALQRKSIPSYSILANNTSATANVTAQQFRDTSGTYSGTITWTGTTAPSGATNHSYRLTQVGKCVTIHIALVFATNGAGLTAVQMTLPSGAPTPAQPTGLTASITNMYPIKIELVNASNNAILSSTARGFLRNNTAANGFEIYSTFSGAAVGQVGVIAQYWTN